MNNYIKNIVEDFDFNAIDDRSNVNAAQNVTNAIMKQYDCVDMGLQSGTLWAKYNIGAKPETKQTKENWNTVPQTWYGDYFAFGEVYPKTVYNYETYKFIIDRKSTNNKPGDFMSKYYYPAWNYPKLDLCDDAAYINTRGMFVTPSQELYEELLKNCIVTRVRHYNDVGGLFGRLFTSKINGAELFFPEADIKIDKEDDELWCAEDENLHNNYNGICFYWTSTLNSGGTTKSHPLALTIKDDSHGTYKFVTSVSHRVGLPVRGVFNK